MSLIQTRSPVDGLLSRQYIIWSFYVVALQRTAKLWRTRTVLLIKPFVPVSVAVVAFTLYYKKRDIDRNLNLDPRLSHSRPLLLTKESLGSRLPKPKWNFLSSSRLLNENCDRQMLEKGTKAFGEPNACWSKIEYEYSENLSCIIDKLFLKNYKISLAFNSSPTQTIWQILYLLAALFPSLSSRTSFNCLA